MRVASLTSKSAKSNHGHGLRALTNGARLAFSALVVLYFAGLALTNDVAQRQHVDSEVISAAAREDSLSERIAHHIFVASHSKDDPSQREQSIEILTRSLADWKLNHEKLANYIKLESAADVSRSMFAAASDRLLLQTLARKTIVQHGVCDTPPEQVRLIQLSFSYAQERVLRSLEEFHRSRTSSLQWVSLLTFVSMLVLLLSVSMLILNPLLRRVQNSVAELEKQKDDLEEMKLELSAQNETLQESQQALNNAVIKSDDMARLSRFSAARFEELFAGLPIAALTFDASGIIFEWNREAEALFGIPAAMALGKPMSTLISLSESKSEYDELVDSVFQGAHLYNIEQRIRRPNGECRLVQFNAFPLMDPEGNINGGVCSLVDITDQRHAEERLRSSERRFRSMVEELPVGAVLVENGSVFINKYIEDLTGYTWRDFDTVDDWFEVVHQGKSEEARSRYESEKAQGFGISSVIEIVRKDGDIRHAELCISLTESTEIWVLNDITERLASQERFQVLFEQSSDAHLLFNETGILDCNEATLKMLGTTERSLVIGQHPAYFSPVTQADGSLSSEKSAKMDQLAQKDGRHRFEWIHQRFDGTTFPVEVTLTPVTLSGKATMLVVWHDLTERKKAEEAIRLAYVELNQAQAIAHIGSWQATSSGKPIWWSEEMYRIFGLSENTIRPTLRHMVRAAHPDDLPELLALIEEARVTGKAWEYELRFRRADGAERIGVITCQPNPIRKRLLGTFQDVTEARLEARRIEESESLFRTTLDAMQSGVAFMGEDGIIKMVNPKGADILGLTIDQVLGREPIDPRWGCMDEEFIELREEDYPLVSAFRTGQPVENFVHGVRRPSGETIWISVNAAPVFLPGKSEPIGAVSGFTDITVFRQQQEMIMMQVIQSNEQAVVLSEQALELEKANIELEKANLKLEELATIDGLTNLKNHRSFQEALEKEVKVSMRSGRALSLLLLDVDKFKGFNDDFGHPAGDEVLRGVSQVLRDVARESDFVARYGGEEFVIVLPDTSEKGAFEAAERFRLAIEQRSWPHRQVTASFGISTLTSNTENRAQLIAQADAALYESKRRGRNCSTHASSLPQAA